MNLKVFKFLFCALLISSLDAYCNDATENIDLKLKNDLLCNLDTFSRPPVSKTPIVLKYMIKNIDHDDYNLITIQSVIRQRWNDTRLKWNPESYENIKGIYVQSEYIWMPKLFLNDSHYHYGLGSCYETACLIKYDGDVICQFPCHQTARCKSDFTDWPFDEQSCDVVFRTFLVQEEVFFDPEEMSGSVIGDNTRQWKLVRALGIMNLTDGTNIKFNFIIQRVADAIYKHVYIPGYVLIILTLSILWMEQGSFLRSIACGLSIFLHFNLMDRVWWQIPSNGTGVPKLVKYMSMMLILATIVFVETIFMKLIFQSKQPSWVRNFSNFISSNAITKYFIVAPFDMVETEIPSQPIASTKVSEEGDLPVEIVKVEEKTFNDWTIFCRFIDRSLFVAFIICYVKYDGY